MTALLTRLFIRDRDNTASPAVRAAYGTMVSITAICLNLLLFAAKYIAGLLTGSIAITADAVNNLSDAGTSLISLITFRVAGKPADRDHPFGHARIEYVASMIVAFLVLHIGLDLLTDSWTRIRTPRETIAFHPAIVIVLAAAILAKLWLALFNRKIGRKIDSAVMRAAAVDSLSDMLSTSAVLASTIIFRATGFDPDGYIGLIVAALILWSGVKILIETKNHILGTAPDAEIVAAIRDAVMACPASLGMHDLVVHNYGPGRTLASLHVEVDGKIDVFTTHDAIDTLEKQLSRDLGIACTIHMDPIVTDDETVNRLRERTARTVAALGLGLTIHDFRCVVGQTHTNLIFDLVVPFECPLPPEQLCDTIRALLREWEGDYSAVITVDRG